MNLKVSCELLFADADWFYFITVACEQINDIYTKKITFCLLKYQNVESSEVA